MATNIIKPKVGEFIVFAETWRGKVAEVTKVTEHTLTYKEEDYDRETRMNLTGAVFSGPKHVAELLAQQLKSSRAQYQEEHNASALRRNERDAKFIAAAGAQS